MSMKEETKILVKEIKKKIIEQTKMKKYYEMFRASIQDDPEQLKHIETEISAINRKIFKLETDIDWHKEEDRIEALHQAHLKNQKVTIWQNSPKFKRINLSNSVMPQLGQTRSQFNKDCSIRAIEGK